MPRFWSNSEHSDGAVRQIARREVLTLAGAAGLALAAPMVSRAALAMPTAPRLSSPHLDELVYEIRFARVPIGEQRLSFTQRGTELAIASATRIKVGIGFLSAYEYKQEARELWRDGRLVEAKAVTEEDGKRSTLRGEAVENGFAVTVQGGIIEGGRTVYPAEIATNNDAWSKNFLGWSQVLDLRDGELLQQQVSERRAERMEIGGKRQEVEHAAVKGRKIAAALWYLDDLLMKAHVSRAGQTVEYREQSSIPSKGLYAEDAPRLAQQPGNTR